MALGLLAVVGSMLALAGGPPAATPASGAGDIAISQGGRVDLIDPSGRAIGRLLRKPPASAISSATWSPDGTRLAYVRDGAVWVSDADGRHARRLAEGDQPAWSPDGATLAVTRIVRDTPLPWQLWLVDVASGVQRQVPSASALSGASWFPDGTRIATTEIDITATGYRTRITTIGLDGSDPRRLTDGLVEGDGQPVVSPDGTRIAFATARDRYGESCGREECSPSTEIYVMAPDGSQPRRLTRSPTPEWPLAWSPDGARLVASRTIERLPGWLGDLVVMNADGGCTTWLTRSLLWEEGVSWRPGSAPGPLDCTHGPAFPTPPEGPSFAGTGFDGARFRDFPVWWLGERVGPYALTYLSAQQGVVTFVYECRVLAFRCRGQIQVQSFASRPGVGCGPSNNRYIDAVSVRGVTGWYRSGSGLQLPLGRHWVTIHGNRQLVARHIDALRNAAAVGPHPRLGAPLPAPAPGMVEPDCPVP
jgi:Tol biopolymer transport system component